MVAKLKYIYNPEIFIIRQKYFQVKTINHV